MYYTVQWDEWSSVVHGYFSDMWVSAIVSLINPSRYHHDVTHNQTAIFTLPTPVQVIVILSAVLWYTHY